ncbi:angiopoietin-4-like [Gigantopelta aegis]|uniref:angiopoietin-4-like n=1 Tax=Gigantopelta aegis TaxID=1735272 RepID=UPI001B88AC60|nr:angiopoietin-4-like [Gigantopelta aegis]
MRALASLLLELLLPLVMTSDIHDYYTEIKPCTSAAPLTTVFQSFPVTSRIRCADICSATSTCKAFSMSTDGTRTCSLHKEPSTVVTCTSAEKYFHKLSESPCLNEGVYNSSTDTCQCFNGYIGSRCEKIMQDCTEGFRSGINTDKDVFWIFPKLAPAPFKVECWMQTRRVTIIQHQRYGNVSFVRSWAEYKSGFGQILGDHWLGNDHVFHVTNSRPQELAMTLQATNSPLTLARYHVYENFRISDESDQYRLNFTSERSINNLGDCLTSLKNAPFSTIDVNNADTCASDFNAGWWFATDTCSACNLNGFLHRELFYWSNVVSHTHWTPMPNNFGVFEVLIFLAANP